MYWVYVLECNNGSFYTGYTNDLEKRYQEHCEGRAAKYTRSFKPVKVIAAWKVFIDKSIAMKIEIYLKSLDRKSKEKLIVHPEKLVDFFGKELVAVELNLPK